MKILVYVGHPAHVHLFRNAIWEWQKRGHKVLIAARDKDVTLALLRHYGFRYEVTSSQKKRRVISLVAELLIREFNLLKIAKGFAPDVFVSVGSVAAAHISKLLRKPHIAFDDTEHSRKQYLLYAPFTDVICTPACFRLDLGEKQIRYNGYQELAYLHPRYFTPNEDALDGLGLSKDEKFIVARFVSWGASHDVGQHGFDSRVGFVQELERCGRVLITSESGLPAELQKHRITVSPEKIHDLLYYATMYIGEGGTMASEAALLGTPSIFVNTLSLGYLHELEDRYGLVYSFADQGAALEKAMELLRDKDTEEKWRAKRKKMLDEKIDVTQFMVDLVEGMYARKEHRDNEVRPE